MKNISYNFSQRIIIVEENVRVYWTREYRLE